MNFPNVKFTVEDHIVDASQDHESLSQPTQEDRERGSREWFKDDANHFPGNQSDKDKIIKEEKNEF